MLWHVCLAMITIEAMVFSYRLSTFATTQRKIRASSPSEHILTSHSQPMKPLVDIHHRAEVQGSLMHGQGFSCSYEISRTVLPDKFSRGFPQGRNDKSLNLSTKPRAGVMGIVQRSQRAMREMGTQREGENEPRLQANLNGSINYWWT